MCAFVQERTDADAKDKSYATENACHRVALSNPQPQYPGGQREPPDYERSQYDGYSDHAAILPTAPAGRTGATDTSVSA